MNRLLVVCLIVAANAALAQGPMQTAPLRKGVRVQMAVTRNASPVPEADKTDAWVVTVTADSKLYFGADPMTPDELAEWMKSHPRNRDADLYIKADARAPFASVEKVLELARVMQFDTPVLLTEQPEHNPPGTMVPPKGEEVSVGSALPSGRIATVVQLVTSGQLKINDDEISWPDLESTLRRHFEKGDDRLVLVKAEAGLRFAEVMRAIDSCRAAQARVYLAESE